MHQNSARSRQDRSQGRKGEGSLRIRMEIFWDIVAPQGLLVGCYGSKNSR